MLVLRPEYELLIFSLQFAGVWYTYSGTTYVYGDNTWDSMINIIYAHEDGSITRVISGHSYVYVYIFIKLG